jgi:hypothetical protein
VERLRERLRVEYGGVGAQRTEALLVELTGAANLDDWLRRFFYPQHVKQLKSHPIAWQLASRSVKGKGRSARLLFECLVYYHATSGDALARLRPLYVEPLLRAEESALTQACTANSIEAAATFTARVQELQDFVSRLREVERDAFASNDLDKLLANEPLDRWSGDGVTSPASRDDLVRAERAWRVDLNDGVRVNIAPVRLAGLLAGDVLKAVDTTKAIADRTRWRADERRWVREGKLSRYGWMPDSVPEVRRGPSARRSVESRAVARSRNA